MFRASYEGGEDDGGCSKNGCTSFIHQYLLCISEYFSFLFCTWFSICWINKTKSPNISVCTLFNCSYDSINAHLTTCIIRREGNGRTQLGLHQALNSVDKSFEHLLRDLNGVIRSIKRHHCPLYYILKGLTLVKRVFGVYVSIVQM